MRRLIAALAFAIAYALLMPGCFLLIMAIFTWELLRWLLFSVMLVPLLAGIGFLGLLKGVGFSGLLIGAIAIRTPDRNSPKLLAAAAVPLVDLLLLRGNTAAHFIERGSLLLMDHRALFLLDTAAPLAASVIAASLIPRRLLRRIAGA